LHVDGNFTLDQAEIYGKLTIAGSGTLEFVDESDPLRKGIITRRGIAGYSVDALGQQYLSSVDAWGPLVLENRPGSGNWKTWLAGEMMRGDPDYRNFRVTRGPTGKVGLFNGDEPLIYITHEGGTIYAGAGKIAGWDIQAEALISPSGNIRLDTEYGIVFRILDVTEGGIEEELEGVENTSVFRAISFIENDISAPIHRIYGMRRTVATGIEADSIVVQSRTEETDNRGEAWFNSISAKEARTVISAIGAFGITGKQQTTRLQLWADRGDGTGDPFAYRRIDAETDALYLTPYTEAGEPAGNKPTGLLLYTTAAGGAWNPGLGAGLYLRADNAWHKIRGPGGDHRWGTTANYANIDANGTLSFTGTARLRPRYRSETKAADFTASMTDGTVYYRVNTTSGSVTATLPKAADANNFVYYFKLINGTNALTIDPDGSETIDGAATWSTTTLYAGVTIISNGTNWEILK
jgi:hypothetical protein